MEAHLQPFRGKLTACPVNLSGFLTRSFKRPGVQILEWQFAKYKGIILVTPWKLHILNPQNAVFFFRWFSFRNCLWLFSDSSHSFSGIFNLLNLFALADTIFAKDQLIDAKLQSFDPDKQSPHPVESSWKMSKPSWSEVHAANFPPKPWGVFP